MAALDRAFGALSHVARQFMKHLHVLEDDRMNDSIRLGRSVDRRSLLRLSAWTVAGLAITPLAGCGGDEISAAEPQVVVAWNDESLAAVRDGKLGPPMVARALAIMHTAMYDAWAAYDPTALGTGLGARLRRPSEEHTAERKAVAISVAAYLALVDLFPAQKERFDARLAALGYAVPGAAGSPSDPEAIGAAAAAAVLALRHDDGANQLGNLHPSGVPYADTSGYQSVNPPLEVMQPTAPSGIVAPDRWQPLHYVDASGVLGAPGFLAAHWARVVPFALRSADQFRPAPPAALGSAGFALQAQQVADAQGALTDEQKVIAEYWADGPRSEQPPGHWMLFGQFVAARDGHGDDQAVKLFFALANAVLDAGIATWEAKRHYDYARPITAIRYLMHGRSLRGYGASGAAGGLRPIRGEAWLPFQPLTFPTPPFAEYTSGHSAFSASAAEVLRLFTGADGFGASHLQTTRSMRIDPAMPGTDVTLAWPTFSAAAQQAGASRVYGGIHFEDANRAGLAIGRKVGAQAFAKAQALWEGRGV